MHIEIDYNGTYAICKVDGRPFNYCKHEDQIFALSAMRCVKEYYDRERKLGRIKGIKQEKKSMEQPLMLQSNCEDCINYDGFGACMVHGYHLVENCKEYKKGE